MSQQPFDLSGTMDRHRGQDGIDYLDTFNAMGRVEETSFTGDARGVSRGQHLLDVGCGLGGDTRTLPPSRLERKGASSV